jgi:hypothetical protein
MNFENTFGLRGHRHWLIFVRCMVGAACFFLLAIHVDAAQLSYRIDICADGVVFGPQSTNLNVVDSREATCGGVRTWGSVSAGMNRADLEIGQTGTYTSRLCDATVSSWELFTAHQSVAGQPVRVTVRPSLSAPWHSGTLLNKWAQPSWTDAGCALDVRPQHTGALPRREFRIKFLTYQSSNVVSIAANAMTPASLTLTNLQAFRVDWAFWVEAQAFYADMAISCRAWYTVDIENGYLTTGSGEPVPTSPGAPHIGLPGFGSPGGGSPGGGSGAGIPIVVTGVPTNNTVRGYVVSSTNLATPATNWTMVLTNTLALDGSLTNTIPIDTIESQRFFRLLLAP